MEKRVRETINEHDLLPHGATVLVAVSGGADSMALLDVLRRMRRSWVLHVAHVHYGVRSDAYKDRAIVAEYCAAYDLPLSVHDLHESAHPHDEAWLRDARYAFFARTARACGAAYCVLGHTRDDLAETVLLNLLRGAGAGGLGAMSYRAVHGGLCIVRPLLDVTRAQTHAYCVARNISYAVDSTNANVRYKRNHVRHVLVPFLRAHYGTRIDVALSHAAHVLRDDAVYLAQQARRADGVRYRRARVEIDARVFRTHHVALQRAILRASAQHIGASVPSFGAVREMRKVVCGTKNKHAAYTTHALLLVRKGDKVIMTRQARDAQ